MKTAKRPIIVSSQEWRGLVAKGQSAAIKKSALVRRDGESISFVASTANPDRYGDTINQQGWKLDSFQKNPVLLWAHDYATPPVGKVGSLDTTGDLTAKDITFTPAETHAFGAQVGAMVRDGFLSAVSVGFMPLKWEMRYDEAGNFAGYNFLEQELLEISVVPVPANAEALLAPGKGLFAKSLGEWARHEVDAPAARDFQNELKTFLKSAENIAAAADDAKAGDDFVRMVSLLERIAASVERQERMVAASLKAANLKADEVPSEEEEPVVEDEGKPDDGEPVAEEAPVEEDDETTKTLRALFG